MTVCAHDDQIDCMVLCVTVDDLGDVRHCFGKDLHVRLNAVARQHHAAQIGSFRRMGGRVDHDDLGSCGIF
jgi:hypothetical protein